LHAQNRNIRPSSRPDSGAGPDPTGGRLSAEQDNLLAAWSWAIGTGNVGTAFQLLTGFAPCEVWNTHPLLLAGEEALGLPGASDHPGYPLALVVSALFASIRGGCGLIALPAVGTLAFLLPE